MADKDAERIKFKTEVLKLTTLVAVAVGGGSIGLFLGELTFLRVTLATVGVLGTLGIVVTLWRLYREIGRLIDALQEDR